MNIKKIFHAFKDRTSWTVARRILVNNDFPTGQGWDKTEEKLSSFQYNEEQLKNLLEDYKHQIMCGEKYVSYYSLSGEQIKKIRDYYANFTVPSNAMSQEYPLPIDVEKTGDKFNYKPIVVGIEKFDDGMAIIYSSVRIVEKRDIISPKDLPNDSADILDAYSEFIGVKRQKIQAYDVLWLPTNQGVAEIRVDTLLGYAKEHTNMSQSKLLEKIEKDTGVKLETPQNMFPLIKKIYQAANEGTVVELAFDTTTASQKHERMRKRSNRHCLRSEAYHLGGKSALKGQIEPFRLGVQWHQKQGGKNVSSPELNILGSSRLLYEASPLITGVLISRCVGKEDFKLVQSKIKSYLAA